MKSSLFVIPVAFVLGCGPSTPAESPDPATTGTPDVAPAPTAQPSAAPVDTAAAAPTAAPSAAPTAAPEAKPAPAPSNPPTVTGTLGGKPFTPKAAITMGPLFKGRVLLAIADYEAACDKTFEPAEGMRTLALQIEWKPGSVGFAADPKKPKEAMDPWHTVVGADKKLKQTKFPATGTVELSAAPQKVGDVARLKLDIKSGKDTVKGEIDVAVCWEIKEEPKKEEPKK
jgi:hypothetical protein